MDLRFVIVDHHSGQPFGRPSLATHRKDLGEDGIERHSFSTGGKDYLCWREGIAALLDDSYRNLGPASQIGVRTYGVDNFSRNKDLLSQLQHYRRRLTEDHGFFSVDETYKKLLQPLYSTRLGDPEEGSERLTHKRRTQPETRTQRRPQRRPQGAAA